MRTTVTLDPDVAALLRKAMEEHGMSFKEALNRAVRAGLGARPEPVRTPTFAMGFDPTIPWDKALALAAALEDDEVARKLASRR